MNPFDRINAALRVARAALAAAETQVKDLGIALRQAQGDAAAKAAAGGKAAAKAQAKVPPIEAALAEAAQAKVPLEAEILRLVAEGDALFESMTWAEQNQFGHKSSMFDDIED